MSAEQRDGLITQFVGVTGATTEQATTALEHNEWNVEQAVAEWYSEAASDDSDDSHQDEGATDAAPGSGPVTRSATVAAGRRLGDGTQQSSTAAPQTSLPPPRDPRRAAARSGGVRTLKDLQPSGGPPRPNGEAEDGDSDAYDESDNEQDLYAGGEKSGLAVQNPGSASDQVNRILDTARRNRARAGGDGPSTARSNFGGAGITLGGDDTPSRVVADPNAQTGTAAPAPVQRLLYLWQDGFSVDDGPLYRYDDPANAATLAMINTGRAPLDILNVQHNQEVDLKVVERRKEKYVTPKKKYVPFSGSGQRLGSPVPGVGDAEAASATIAARMTTTTTTTATPTADAPPSTSSDASAAADAWQPTVLVQVRLSDGSRLQSRFNTTQSIGDLYRFVDRSRPCSSAYILMTTFPNKDQTDKTLLLGDTAELKRGGVVIQKLV